MKERVRWIDISRGIAIILVVMAHVISSYQETGMYKDSAAFAFIHQFTYSFVMPVFMIVCTVTGCLLPLFTHWLSTKIWKLEFCFYPGKYLKAAK